MNAQTDKFLEIFNSIDFHKIKDHPNILIAANFWEEERLCAAKICYKFMRTIDDLIDNHKSSLNYLEERPKRRSLVASLPKNSFWVRLRAQSSGKE